MGYRSTVAYTIRFIQPRHDKPEEVTDVEDVKASFYTFIAEAKSREDTALCFSKDESEVFEVDEEKLQLRFFADYVKWYEDYPDVMCHEALIQLSKDWCEETENRFIGGAFARVGEEMDDNVHEVWGEGDYDWVSINRSVYCDWLA
jgi:hypothetical protein